MRSGPGDLKLKFAATCASVTRPVCARHIMKYVLDLRAGVRFDPLFEGDGRPTSRFPQALIWGLQEPGKPTPVSSSAWIEGLQGRSVVTWESCHGWCRPPLHSCSRPVQRRPSHHQNCRLSRKAKGFSPGKLSHLHRLRPVLATRRCPFPWRAGSKADANLPLSLAEVPAARLILHR
jgi:hypothetical protein